MNNINEVSSSSDEDFYDNFEKYKLKHKNINNNLQSALQLSNIIKKS